MGLANFDVVPCKQTGAAAARNSLTVRSRHPVYASGGIGRGRAGGHCCGGAGSPAGRRGGGGGGGGGGEAARVVWGERRGVGAGSTLGLILAIKLRVGGVERRA